MLYRFTNYPGAQTLFKLVSHNIKINIVTRLLPLEVSCEVCHQHWHDKGQTLDSHCVKHQRGCASFYLPQRLKSHHDFHSVFIFPLLLYPMCPLLLHFPANISNSPQPKISFRYPGELSLKSTWAVSGLKLLPCWHINIHHNMKMVSETRHDYSVFMLFLETVSMVGITTRVMWFIRIYMSSEKSSLRFMIS